MASVTGERPHTYTSPTTRHHVRAVMNYYRDPGDGRPPSPNIVGKPETYFKVPEPLEVLVTDISDNVEQYTLDGNGFQIYHHESREKEFVDQEKIKAEYYPEMEQFVKDITQAKEVLIFDHTVRRQNKEDKQHPFSTPVRVVHVDQSNTSAENRVEFHFPDDSARLLRGRYQILNAWRPIKRIYKAPLAVADALSVPDSDLVPIPLIYTERTGETCLVRPNAAHKWFFKYAQSPEEVIVFKCFDSKKDGRARRSPHTAFIDPETEGMEPRESIEVRALVFHPDDVD